MKTIMKHLKLACLLLVCSTGFAQAPGFHYGFKFGMGAGTLSIPNTPAEVGRPVLETGFASSFQFTRMIGISADALLGLHGGYVDEREVGRTYQDRFHLYQAQVPIALKFSIPLNESYFLRLYGGPSINFNLASREERRYINTALDEERGYHNRPMDDMEPMNYSMVFGAGVEYITKGNKILFFDAKGNEGLTPVGRIYGVDAKMSSYMLTVGLLF